MPDDTCPNNAQSADCAYSLAMSTPSSTISRFSSEEEDNSSALCEFLPILEVRYQSLAHKYGTVLAMCTPIAFSLGNSANN